MQTSGRTDRAVVIEMRDCERVANETAVAAAREYVAQERAKSKGANVDQVMNDLTGCFRPEYGPKAYTKHGHSHITTRK